MESSVRYSGLERFVNKHKTRIEEGSKELIGKKVVRFLGTDVNQYIESEVELNDGETMVTQYRLAELEEENNSEENIGLTPEDREYIMPMETYYRKHILGGTITSLSVGYERDDEAYLYCYIDDTIHRLEVPLGVTPEEVDENGDPIDWEPDSL